MTLDEPNPNPLIAGLGSADARKRENAANALIAAPDPSAEGPLIEALDDPEAGVRGQAALAIGSLGCRSTKLWTSSSSPETNDAFARPR